MKLRNKKTGEIVDYISFEKGGGQISMYVFDTNTHYYYNSLAELNAEWEDYEEPKDVYFIDSDGNVVKSELEDGKIITTEKQQIGNYFETKEDAEKAVEKLKAIKRLKDCGFKFDGYDDSDRGDCGDIIIFARVDTNGNLIDEAQPKMLNDLDLLFGGEE